MPASAGPMQAVVTGWDRRGPTHIIDLQVAEPFRHAAGQYLFLCHPGGVQIPFSIASPPALLPQVQLHYQPTVGHPHTTLMEDLRHQTAIDIGGPAGDVCPGAAGSAPLIGLAEESGISQPCCIAAQFHAERSQRAVTVWWACPSGDRYCETALAMVAELHILDHRDVVSALPAIDPTAEIILCGSPQWVHDQADQLQAQGVPPGQLQADVFSYAPRRAP